jgi:hypothetical protein
MKLRKFKIVHLLASGTFKAPAFPYVFQTRTCINSYDIDGVLTSSVAIVGETFDWLVATIHIELIYVLV